MNQSNLNRRNFIKAGVIGTTGAFMAKLSFASDTSETERNLKSPEKKDETIITRILGKTGIVLPIVSMGVMRADNPSLVKAALEKGIVHLDTAHGYQEGRNETMLGNFLKDYPREKFVISTKAHISGISRSGQIEGEIKPEELTKSLDISLSRLGLEFVDIFYLHGAASRDVVLHKSIIKELLQIKKSGKARYIGLSTHQNMPLVIDAAVESGIYDVVLTSYNYQMSDNLELAESISRASDAGLGVIAMKTMAGGFNDKERKMPVNTKAALKWALQNEKITTSIPGFTSFEQLNDSFSVMENLNLLEEEKNDLFGSPVSASLYCQGCNFCAGTCSNNLPIPDIMRAYMYTYGYRDPGKAQELLMANNDIADSPCNGCKVCTVSCVKGFNVTERVNDVIRIKEIPREFFA